jgi:hypothetical protein
MFDIDEKHLGPNVATRWSWRSVAAVLCAAWRVALGSVT